MPLVARLRFAGRLSTTATRQSARAPQYHLGSDVTAWADFTDAVTGEMSAASGVSFAFIQADGTPLSPAPAVVTESTGVYRATVTPTQVGEWQVTVDSSTAAVEIDVRTFSVIADDVEASMPVEAEVSAAVIAAGVAASAAAVASEASAVASAASADEAAQSADDAEAAAAQARAAADTTSATVVNASVQRETLAALTAAMAASTNGALGVVYGLNADEGVYRSDGAGGLTRESDTQRQLSARADIQDDGAAQQTILRIEDDDAGALDLALDADGGLRQAGTTPRVVDDLAAGTTLLRVLANNGDASDMGLDSTGALRLIGTAPPLIETIVEQGDGANDVVFRLLTPINDALDLALDSDGVLRKRGSSSDALSYGPGHAAYYGVTGDGSDESAKLKSAHDAAFEADVTSLDFGLMQVTAPSALNLGNVVFRGQKQLVGTFRKRVIPPGTPALQLLSGIAPGRHLTAMMAAASPVVALMGDSTGVPAEAMHPSLGLWSAIQRKMTRDNPHKSFTFYNRSISGTQWSHGDDVPSSNHPSWYADLGRDWLLYIADLAPDVLFFNWGMNDGATEVLTPMISVIAKVQAWAKVPDIIFCTNLCGSLQDATYGTREGTERRDSNAGLQRTYARRSEYGVIDFHRAFVAARDGFDVLEQPMERVSTSGATTLPYTFARECTDYIFDFYHAASFNSMVASGQVLNIPLSPQATNAIRLRLQAGVWQYQVQTSDAVIPVAWTSTGIASATRIAGSVASDGWCTVEINSTQIFGGYCDRFGGLFAPRIGLVGDDTPFTCTLIRAAVGVPRIVAPLLTDYEMWGDEPSGEDLDGNPPNHAAARGAALVYFPAVSATNFAV